MKAIFDEKYSSVPRIRGSINPILIQKLFFFFKFSFPSPQLILAFLQYHRRSNISALGSYYDILALSKKRMSEIKAKQRFVFSRERDLNSCFSLKAAFTLPQQSQRRQPRSERSKVSAGGANGRTGERANGRTGEHGGAEVGFVAGFATKFFCTRHFAPCRSSME